MQLTLMAPSSRRLVEGVDFYMDNGRCVLTAAFLLQRKKCCKNQCRHCPYESNETIASDESCRVTPLDVITVSVTKPVDSDL